MIYRTLQNDIVTLRPIHHEDRERLREAAKFDHVWTNTTLMNHYDEKLFNAWFALAFNNSQGPSQKCFVFEKDGKLIGSSRYYGISEKEISIGYTWISPSYWGTKVNPSIKYLMLNNVFENGYERVFFHTDILNLHSQAAIQKLGATFVKKTVADKIRPDGTLRDTMEYVIDQSKWPEIKEGLLKRINA